MRFHPKKWEDVLTFTALVLAMILLNQISGFRFFRLDLTEEKRYTISQATKEMLQNLEDEVYIEVYLEGELNSEFKRLQKSIRETLDEFAIYADGKVSFKFTNPSQAPNAAARNRFYQQLVAKGLPATTLYEMVEGKRQERVIFPGATISYQKQEQAVLLLKGNKASSEAQQINQSVEGVEYELATAINKLTISQKKRVAILEGHNELNKTEMADALAALEEFYQVENVSLQNTDLQGFDALIVAQPKTAFSELEKFRLDQYVMRGGSTLFLIDKVQMNLDSISKGGTYAFGYDLNLEDLLFRYGVRLNIDLIQDQQAGVIEVVTGNFGNRPSVKQLPWTYYAYLNKFSDHLIVRNMDVIYSKFVSTIDTVKAVGIRKTPLVFTSKYTKIKELPALVSLDQIKESANRQLYDRSHLPVAYLLEGEFKSLYANGFAPKEAAVKDFIKSGKPAKVIVFADADIIRSEIDRKTGKPLAIDIDQRSKQLLSNKEFILNALSYLTDEKGLISARAKQVNLRPLDPFRINDEKLYWQILNIAFPVSLVVLFGIVRYYWRKRKFER